MILTFLFILVFNAVQITQANVQKKPKKLYAAGIWTDPICNCPVPWGDCVCAIEVPDPAPQS